jgi:glycosyltransferase involved in cell wall biosynthesis
LDTHTAKAGTLGRLAAILAGVPVLVHTFHGHVLGGGYFSPLKTWFFLQVERQLARATDRLVVLTERQATEMAEELGVADWSKFVVVPLGLELERFAEVDREVVGPAMRSTLGIGPDELVIGIVGRMVPIKNHELWLEAVGALSGRADRPVRGLVVGSGEREAELRVLAEELGVSKRILWLGWRRDLPELYAAMDVLALTSHDEGTPVAVIEALAAGTRVLARDVGGVAEVLSAVGANDGSGRWCRCLGRRAPTRGGRTGAFG